MVRCGCHASIAAITLSQRAALERMRDRGPCLVKMAKLRVAETESELARRQNGYLASVPGEQAVDSVDGDRRAVEEGIGNAAAEEADIFRPEECAGCGDGLGQVLLGL